MRPVFSAHAEVVHTIPRQQCQGACILRARGGSSNPAVFSASATAYSPRTRR
ncbi:hypothetical protein CORMATOL_00225 [Corynebacterium matruchotii ATCC 33806]|uniref:Uncharacterized protein n=1 Tax=Corynebacterium matruchotii ATCC 33806 TaxID=566549 RepID=C0DZS9_9CORY|nr:hypothetical protein CORMATOL_00225 [Corynebacterium matruchotii ATCC 33806]